MMMECMAYAKDVDLSFVERSVIASCMVLAALIPSLG